MCEYVGYIMADVKMDEFLLQYYMQRRFNTMPPTVRAQFDVYVKSDDFRGNMKTWKSKLMHPDANGKWVENGMPDPTDVNDNFHMDDKEWEKLFKAFQNTFRAMAENKSKFEKTNKNALEFLNEYFGNAQTKLFSNGAANPQVRAEDQIRQLYQLLSDNQYRATLGFYIRDILSNAGISYSDLLRDIQQPTKYNTDVKLQGVIQRVAEYMNYYIQNDTKLGQSQYAQINFEDIDKWFDDPSVDPTKLQDFKDNHKDLLNTLVTDSKVYDVFKEYDNGKISKHIDAANANIDYANKDSKDYVPPKRDDELTPWQQLKDNVSDTWSDYMDKYIKLRGDRLYFSPSAKLIFKALTGAKVKFKPTDGLAKVIDSAGDIKKNLMYKSPRAVDHFDWMVKTLGELQNTMPRAFAGALKNGRQMKAIVSELIVQAVRENKMDEAKTAMEVLSVVKYGYTTSKIMDTLGKEKLSIFSDGGLSWNKNQAVQFVTNAMDKSIKYAFMAVGYAITMGGNAIRLNGSKFNGKTGRVGDAHTTWMQQKDADLSQTRQHNDAENQKDSTKKQQFETALQRLDSRGFNANTIGQKKTDLQNAENLAQRRHGEYEQAQERYGQSKSIVDTYDGYTQTMNNLHAEMQSLANDVADLESQLQNANTFANMPPATQNALAADLMRQLNEKRALGQQKLAEYNDAYSAQQQMSPQNVAHARADMQIQQQRMNTALRRYNNAQRRAANLSAKIDEFENATQSVAELNQRMQKRDQEIRDWDKNHQDKYRELMAYWDFLETGRDSHTGTMYSWTLGSAKEKQKKFDKNAAAKFQAYLNKYQLAA